MIRVYHIQGIRHQAVVFAETPGEAVAQAIERRLVGDWEYPEAIEVPLPPGYRILYNPAFIPAQQAELPLALDEPAPVAPYVLTRSGIKVYADWRDNIVVDADARAVTWKAARDTFARNTTVPGRSRLASENSEDALCWNLFRTLEKAGRLDALTRPLGLDGKVQVLYWHRPWDAADPLPEIGQALRRIEPWRKLGGRFQSETDVILKGRRTLVLVDARLGKPGAQIRSWERVSRSPVPAVFEEPLRDLLLDMANWQKTMRRFYPLLRHLILANELCQPGVWDLEPHLLAIVNELNRHAGLIPHADEFAHFQRCLRLPPGRTHLVTWQALLARAKATFEPGVRPLLAHAAQLSYLQPPISEAPDQARR